MYDVCILYENSKAYGNEQFKVRYTYFDLGKTTLYYIKR